MPTGSAGSSSGSIMYCPSHFCNGNPCTICYPQYNWNFPQYHMVPHRCPVCDGRTTVPATFYEPAQEGTAAGSGRVQCRACYGAGVIWGA
jgi:hypothetical protein